jgi:hypothetical protein
MTPEELAEARHYAACYQDGYVHDLMHNLLDHIDQQAARIAALVAQLAALKKIAEEERAYILSANVMESIGVDEFLRTEARRQLAKEHPEAFR